MSRSDPYRPIALGHAPKRYTHAQDKVVDPSTTIQRALEGLVALGDIVDLDLEERQGAVEGAYAYTTASASLDTSGKGLTKEQALASAVMEFAERTSWLRFDYQSYPGYRVASHDEIRAAGLPTVPLEFFLSNIIDVRDREALLAEIRQIPLKWIAATRLEPEGALYYPINWQNMLTTTNGLAAGNTMEEAILQGVCEVIERECVYRLFVEGRPGIDIEATSIENPLLVRAMENGRRAGIELTIKEISGELGVPTFIVRGTRPGDRGKATYQGVGQGTHPDPAKALMRALSEYFEGLSSMATSQAASPLDLGALAAFFPKRHYGFHALYNAEVLDESSGTARLGEIQSVARPDIHEELRFVVHRLEGQGYPVGVVDKTYPRLGIPAVRVFVPGMRNCISTEFFGAPSLTLSAVYFEAGNLEASTRHARRAFELDPSWDQTAAPALTKKMSWRALGAEVDPSQMFGRDFQESLARTGRIKKGGVDTLKAMAEQNPLLEATLAALGALKAADNA